EALKREVVPMKKSLRRLYEVKQEREDTIIHIKNQRQQAEKQIREEFEEIRQFLEKQELVRIALLAEEEEEKLLLMKKNTDRLLRDILMFSHAVRTIDEEIAYSDLVFLKHYKNTKKRTHVTFKEPEKVPAALINVAKHVSSLKFSLWEKMQAMVEY
ncbi:E3 ubiquitin-protein ligase TRIM39-like, partial [Clarias magur]